VLHFICNYLILQEQCYCFYLRKGVRHYKTSANSGHEGTNNAIKAGPSCITRCDLVPLSFDVTEFVTI
jgi:hypothetical protein